MDKKFNDPSEKAAFIESLQSYGSIEKPGILRRIYLTFKRFLGFNNVGMMGDGENDVSALKQADLSVCIGKLDNLNQGASDASHFSTDHDHVSCLPSVFDALRVANRYKEMLVGAAFLYNISMLSLVNGLDVYLFGITLPTPTVCLLAMCFCCGLILAASNVRINQSDLSLHKQKQANGKLSCCDLSSNDFITDALGKGCKEGQCCSDLRCRKFSSRVMQ